MFRSGIEKSPFSAIVLWKHLNWNQCGMEFIALRFISNNGECKVKQNLPKWSRFDRLCWQFWEKISFDEDFLWIIIPSKKDHTLCKFLNGEWIFIGGLKKWSKNYLSSGFFPKQQQHQRLFYLKMFQIIRPKVLCGLQMDNLLAKFLVRLESWLEETFCRSKNLRIDFILTVFLPT